MIWSCAIVVGIYILLYFIQSISLIYYSSFEVISNRSLSLIIYTQFCTPGAAIFLFCVFSIFAFCVLCFPYFAAPGPGPKGSKHKPDHLYSIFLRNRGGVPTYRLRYRLRYRYGHRHSITISTMLLFIIIGL